MKYKNPKRQLQGAQAKAVGQHFENMIDAACRYYETQKIAIIEKTPEPMRVLKSLGGGKFVACFEKQAQPDYKGTLSNGRTVVFEAKHTSTDKIDKNRLTEEQAKRLQKYSEMGAITFILVSIGFEKFYRVPWTVWKNMKELYGHKHMTVVELEPYEIKTTGGIIRFLEGDVIKKDVIKKQLKDERCTNFDRITRNKAALIHFVQIEVLDLYGPHINHSINKFKSHKKFWDWLNEEVDP